MLVVEHHLQGVGQFPSDQVPEPCAAGLGEQNIEDPRIPRMFAELLDELTGAPDDSPGLAPAGHGEA